MAKTLVLAEKPSVGKDIARVLKCTQGGKGYLEGSQYIVTWALGHLVGLADPEVYDDKYKTWSMEQLPMLPKEMKLTILKGSGKQYSVVKEQMHRKDVNEIVIATDAGREGELVARWIIEKAKVRKTIKRLWISSVTDKAIKDGFNNLKPGNQYDNLYKAAVCRAEGDWVVGLNVTRALTCKYNAQLSAGRVQSAALAMIVEREEEIKQFRPKNYYVISAQSSGFALEWKGKDGKNIFDEAKAKEITAKVQGKKATITQVNQTAKKQFAPALYDLTELQRDANRLFGFSPKETSSLMQKLYENFKILTYPRTDSRYISQDIVETLPDRLKAISLGGYKVHAQQILTSGVKAHKGFVDNSKVSDHHAIIPTEEKVELSKLTSNEKKIYDLVVKRFLAVMMPPCEYLQTTVDAEIDGETFTAKGKTMKQKGFRAVYQNELEEDDEGNQSLPEMKQGDSIAVVKVNMDKHQTKPPARFNEATLLSAMENPAKYVQLNKQDAQTLKETGGIGTVATRADIIEKLYNMYYIEKNGKDIMPTSKGKQLIDLVPAELKSPLLTAKWERELDLISKGKQDPEHFMKRMKDYAKELVVAVKSSNDNYNHDNMIKKRCPECGKYMLEVKGKHGMMHVCQDRACGKKETVSKFTHSRCPECHKKLEVRGQGDGAMYVCTTCTFREKASSFNKKHKGNKQEKGNKKDAAKYMKKMQQENEAPMNTALAEALAKLMNK